MPKAMLTLFIMTTLDEWPLIQRQLEASNCDVCAGSYLWPMMLSMVILLSMLGANLFIAVLTYAYSQVLNRQHSAKKRLGDLARQQDGPSAVIYMEGEVQKVAMHQLLGHHGIGLKYGAGAHEGAVTGSETTMTGSDNTATTIDTDGDGNANQLDTTGDGQANLVIVAEEDTTGDGNADTLIVQEVGSNDMSKLSVVMDNPRAWPHVPGLSEPCRKMCLSKRMDQVIGFVILSNAIVMASSTYPENDLQQYLDGLDLVFIAIYVTEVIVKFLGLGAKPYFAVPFYDLDFAVVVASIVSLMYPEAKGATASRMIRLVLRVIRMLRLLKLVSNVDTVVYLIKALTTSGGSLMYMTV